MSFAARGIRHVFIRNLELPAHIGVYRQEEGRTQPVRINVDLATDEIADAQDMLENVVDYHVIEKRIRMEPVVRREALTQIEAIVESAFKGESNAR